MKGIMQDLSKKVTFSTPESFQLVMTGVRYLRAYERKAEPDSLDRATEALGTGMRKFPDDIAPRFYLGVAMAISGAKNSREAVDLLEDLLKRVDKKNIEDLRLAVKYNLASAHAGTYKEEGFERARDLLNQVLKESTGAIVSSELALRGQAEILLIWLDIRTIRDQRLAIIDKRKRKVQLDQYEIADFEKKLNEIQEHLRKFKEKFERENVADHDRNEVMADFWNNWGIVEWDFAEATELEDERAAHGKKAIKSFQESLKCKINWPPPRSNIANVYHEIFNDRETAKDIWLSILDTEPTHDFAMLNLGDLAVENAEEEKDTEKSRASWDEALEWYSKAESRGATFKQANVLLENLNRPQDAKAILDELLANLDPTKSDDAKDRSKVCEVMGRIQERLGNIQEAIAAYTRSDQPKAREALLRLSGGISGSGRP
jgi:tetratricopeptide (TPR) repeat protein